MTPTEPPTDERRDAVERIMGWRHLRKYAGMSDEWMDQTRDAIIRVVQDAARLQSPVTEPTEAEVDAATKELTERDNFGYWDREDMRAALNAARSARPDTEEGHQ